MSYRYITINTFFILIAIIVSCATVPLTGRRQLDLIPTSTMLSMSFQQYDEFLKANKQIGRASCRERVCVGV